MGFEVVNLSNLGNRFLYQLPPDANIVCKNAANLKMYSLNARKGFRCRLITHVHCTCFLVIISLSRQVSKSVIEFRCPSKIQFKGSRTSQNYNSQRTMNYKPLDTREQVWPFYNLELYISIGPPRPRTTHGLNNETEALAHSYYQNPLRTTTNNMFFWRFQKH